MNHDAKTYHTPSSALMREQERPGALYYGTVVSQVGDDVHEVAIIRVDGAEVLCSGPTFFGWRHVSEVTRAPD
jgi:hypothetical protein